MTGGTACADLEAKAATFSRSILELHQVLVAVRPAIVDRQPETVAVKLAPLHTVFEAVQGARS